MKPYNHKNQQDEIKLSGLLSEFRIALNEEIEAARRHESSSAVPLVNGKKIAQIGNNYQYIFQIENILNLPGDAPGDLILPERLPLSIFVISVDGLTITLSIPENIGDFVPFARLQSNLAFLMRKLIDRIEAYGDKPNPVGKRILAPEHASGDLPALTIDSLDNYKKRAVTYAIGYNTSFIWGPPGTGKTMTIGEIGNQLYRRQRSVLVVSHTNTAVDQAILRIADKITDDELSKGRVLRVGDTKDKRLIDKPNLLLATHVAKKAEELTGRKQSLLEEIKTGRKELIRISNLINIIEWVDEAERDISRMYLNLNEIQKREEHLVINISEFDRISDLKKSWEEAAEEAKKVKNLIVESEFIKRDIDILSTKTFQLKDGLTDISNKLSDAQELYELTSSVGLLMRRWKRLPKPEQQKIVVDELNSKMGKLGIELDEQNQLLKDYNQKYSELIDIIETYKNAKSDPELVLTQASDYFDKLNQLNKDIQLNSKICSDSRNELEELVKDRLLVLKDMGLTQIFSDSADIMLDAIKEAINKAHFEIGDQNLEGLKRNLKEANDSIIRCDKEIEVIDEKLKNIEDLIISEASIVATTLTRAYLRESIQNRRFDSVILDEASMAPIPALWVAASIANNNAVVVGDPKQLPPIVMSTHDLAKKWLGRDIFEAAGLKRYGDEKPCLTMLRRQYRMHPRISIIQNDLIYEGRLEDGAWNIAGEECDLSDTKCDNRSLLKWYNIEWGHDNPVVLIDTGSAGAWVTSVSRGNRASRVNFLSATISVDLAFSLLKPGREPVKGLADDPRILIICPYHPHAKLLNLLIRDQKLEDEVRAGTVHNFQGSECDVVILDLVNDEPHFRVGMFIPKLDDMTKRLINVAVTRAKRRLFILGDFDYIEKLSKRAFLGSSLIPFLKKNFPKYDALDLIPSGIAARSARAQLSILGGKVEPDSDRIVLTQNDFYPFLRNDIGNAKDKVVIYSAFITSDRLSDLQPLILSATERNIRFYVITKALEERNKKEIRLYRSLENSLREWGVTVVHKRKMHKKLIFIDDEIVWIGSLNTLSFSNTQEIMERRASRTIVSDYVRTLRLNELVSEYQHGSPQCPICGEEIVASEGREEPYYWRCVQDKCYTRSIDQPKLEGNKIVCSNCGSKLKYGEWGGKPYWRCVENKRHRLPLARTHLLLPEMRKIVPKKELVKLVRMFGINLSDSSSKDSFKQAKLFSLNHTDTE